MRPNIYFISDCHLREDFAQINRLFQSFLQKDAIHAQALYILGDLFDVWIGDDDTSTFVKEVQGWLKNLVSQGTKIYFLRGNRDFLIGKRFCQQTGSILLPQPTIITLLGQPTLLLHGDTLCTKDKKYQRYRKIAHHSVTRYLFEKLSLAARQKIAQRLRVKSQKHQNKIAYSIMDVTETAVETAFKKYGVTRLIHGHTHRPNHHITRWGDRYVLGDWTHHSAKILRCYGNKLELWDLLAQPTEG